MFAFSAEAHVSTDRAGRYLTQLCHHVRQLDGHADWQRHGEPGEHGEPGGGPLEVRDVDFTATDAVIRLATGQWTMHADTDMLTIRVEADGEETLQRLMAGVSRRIETAGRRDELKVAWSDSGSGRRGGDAVRPPGRG